MRSFTMGLAALAIASASLVSIARSAPEPFPSRAEAEAYLARAIPADFSPGRRALIHTAGVAAMAAPFALTGFGAFVGPNSNAPKSGAEP